MRRDQFEHILRAAGAITNEKTFVVIGSQSLLASYAELSPPLDQSMELDLYPANNPAAATLIDGSIGELSPFDETFGCYAHGVAAETAVLPADWEKRAIVVENENTGGARGLCISPADLAISKLAAGREKDISFVRVMLDRQMTTTGELLNILNGVEDRHRESIRQRIVRMEQG